MIVCASILALVASQPNFGETPQGNPAGAMVGDAFLFQWEGVSGRTYFVRTSSDMQDWDFIPEIEHGEGNFHYGFESTNDTLFVQLVYTDTSALVDGEVNPEEADFDGDGLPSLHELLNGLNPLDSETVDGILDGDADREMDGRLDGAELSYPAPLGPSHPSRVDNPKVKLAVQVLP